MFKRLYGNTDYCVALDGRIYDINGRLVFENQKEINYEVFGKVKNFKRKFITLLSWYEIENIPNSIEHIDKVKFFNIKSKNLTLKSEYLMAFKEPIYYRSNYRFIPSFPRYAITIDGNVLDTKTNTHVNRFTDGNGYYTLSLYSPDKCRYINVQQHRLIALAWLPNDDFLNRFYINHIDGNKKNNELTNLEWCTHQENVHHALDIGLNATRIKMKTRDVLTGKIEVYTSIAELNRKIGSFYNGSRSVITKLPGHLFNGRYEVKPFNDNSDWYYENNEFVESGYQKRVETIHVFDKRTGEKKDFKNIKELEIYYGFAKKSLNIESRISELKEKAPYLDINYERHALKGPYVVLNTDTNEKHLLPSLKSIAKFTSVGLNEIQLDLTRNNKYIYCKKWVIYQSSKKIDIKEYQHKKPLSKRVEVTDEFNRTIGVYDSIKETSRQLQMDPKGISKAVKTGKIHNKLKFRALDE